MFFEVVVSCLWVVVVLFEAVVSSLGVVVSGCIVTGVGFVELSSAKLRTTSVTKMVNKKKWFTSISISNRNKAFNIQYK